MTDLNLPKKRKFLNIAPWWKRFAAFFIDFLIIQFVIFSPFTGILEEKISPSGNIMEDYRYFSENPEIVSELTGLVFAVFILIYAYFVAFEKLMGQTPGRMLFGLYLVPAKKKDKITFWNILVRNLAIFPFFPFSILWVVDPLYMIVTGNRLSDNITGTRIVEEISI